LDFLVYPLCLAVALKVSFDLTYGAKRDEVDRFLTEVFHISKEQAKEHSKQVGILTMQELLGGEAEQEQDALADNSQEERMDEQDNENHLPPLLPLDRSEDAELQNAAHEGHARRMDVDDAILDMLDLDHDGQVDHEEISQAVEAVVAQIDDDGDGEISEGELAEIVGAEAAASMMKRYDQDGDHHISKEELTMGYEVETHRLNQDNKTLLLELVESTGRNEGEVHRQLQARFFAKRNDDARAGLQAERERRMIASFITSEAARGRSSNQAGQTRASAASSSLQGTSI